jgi:hypothetical protein
LAHELKGKGIAPDKIVIAFNQVRAESELAFARAYLKEAGLTALPESLRALLSYRTVQNVGRGVTEAETATVKKEARATMAALAKRLQETAAPQMEERFKLEPERFKLAARGPAEQKRRRRR